MDNRHAKEKKVYDRIATVLNYNRGEGHSAISVNSIANDYRDTGPTSLEQDWKDLGYKNPVTLLRKLKFQVTQSNMVKTYVPGSKENGAAGVIDLMQKTRADQKRRYRNPRNISLPTRRTSQSSGAGTHAIQDARYVLPELSPSGFRPHWSEYYVPTDLAEPQQSLSETTLISSTQVPGQNCAQPSSSVVATHQQLSQRHKRLNERGNRSTSTPTIQQPSINVQAVSNEDRGLSTSPSQCGVLSESQNTSTGLSSGEITTTANDRVYVVKAVIFDNRNMNWKIALERPRTEEDAEFFKFCKDAHMAIKKMEKVPIDELIKGKCYLVELNGKYYRGIYIAGSRDNVHGIFDFADFEVIRPIAFSTVRPFPNVKKLIVPCMINWIYTTDFPNVQRNDCVRCTFLPTFEETGFRKIHQANVQKIQT